MIRRRLRPAGLRIIALLLLVVLCGSCTRSIPPDREARLAALGPDAQRLYAQLEWEHLLHRDAQVLEFGASLLETDPDHPFAPDVVVMMIVSALRLPDPERARELALSFPRRFPGSLQIDHSMLGMADQLASAGQSVEAMRVLALLAEALIDPSRRQVAVDRAKSLRQRLSDSELLRLSAGLADTPLSNLLQVEMQRRGVAAVAVPEVAVESGHLGVLVPLTGRYARFGNAFLAGVRLAADAVPAPRGERWRVLHEDTEGDVVTAALVARRLAENGGCRVLIGALLSATTATAALVAEHLGVPLISPTATHERLNMLGDMVLQTNRTGPTEADILARLACEVLLKQRFAIIRSDTPEGLNLAKVFSSSVMQYGGSVIHEEVFDPAATDYRLQVERLRAARPEVVFVQASVDQMILLGPQLDFYRVGALVLGTSEWNSARLLQRAGSVLERAVFPASEILYPAVWSASFEETWPSDQHDEEATRIARSAYLAARLVLHAMAVGETGAAVPLAERLRAVIAGSSVDLEAAEAFSAAVRVIESGQIMPFPGHLYEEALRRDALARADTTAGAMARARGDTTTGAPAWRGTLDRP